MLNDCCSFCEHESEYNSDLGDELYIFLDSRCHYVFHACPACGHTTSIYIDPEEVIDVLEAGIRVKMYARTPKIVRGYYNDARHQAKVEEAVAGELEDMFRRTQPELEA